MRSRILTALVAVLVLAAWTATGFAAAPATPTPTAAAQAPKASPAAPTQAPPAPVAPATAQKPPSAAPVAAPTSDAAFFAELGYKDVATASDVARAMMILVSEGKETGADFEAARAYLRTRSVLPDGWLDKARPDEPVEKANLARLVCRTLDIKGGLWMHLVGPAPRLALRECVYLELMIRGAENAHVVGGELVGVIDQCDRWRTRQAIEKMRPAAAKASGKAEEKK